MENLKIEAIRIFIVGVVFFLVFSIPLTSAADASTWRYSSTDSNPQYYQPGAFTTYSQDYASIYWPALSNPDKCEATTDFMMFIRPGGCSPQVVRSDLLEEQNVPVFCKVDIIKINPLIDVTQIKSVKFKGTNPYVAGVSFHPNREAIMSYKGILDNPLINDVGYVVVLLKKIPAEKDMPESVRVNITGVLRYDMEGFFGAGQNDYYLEEMNESNWRENYKSNGFWKGKGYLRADWVDNDKAGISIYLDEDEKLTSFVLNKGEASRVYYMPGFYCKAGVQVRLDDISAGAERVELRVDGNKLMLTEGERFLDNECQVLKIDVEEKKENEEVTETKKSVTLRCRGKSQELSYVAKGEKSVEEEPKKTESETEGIIISQDIKDGFKKAEDEAQRLESLYGGIGSSESGFGEIWAAKAFFKLGELAKKIGAKYNSVEFKEKAKTIFLKIIETYPDTVYSNEAEERITELDIPNVDYGEHYIELVNIIKPSAKEASASFNVRKIEENKEIGREEGIVVQEKDSFGYNEFQLIKLYPDKVDLKFNGERFELSYSDRIKNFELDNKEYVVTLGDINLEQLARVSLLSRMPNEYSEADFTFEIGIEKRAIQLTPEKTKERIENLDESIEKWSKIVENLGKIVSGMKAVCFATSAYLVIKNFFVNLGGGATARQEVMPAYYKDCERKFGKGEEFDNCLEKANDNIKTDMGVVETAIKNVNNIITETQKKHLDEDGNVKRAETVSELVENNFKEGFTYTPLTVDKEGKIISGKNKTISAETLKIASLTDIRDLMKEKEILIKGTDVMKYEASLKIEEIASRLEKKSIDIAPYGNNNECDVAYKWLNKFRVSYYQSGKQEKLAYIVPIPNTYFGYPVDKEGNMGKDRKEFCGFYAVVKEGGYTEAGDLKLFWIQNIGADSVLDEWDDQKISIDMNTFERRNLNFPGIQLEFDKLVRDAEQAIRIANRNYGRTKFNLLGREVYVDVVSRVGEKRCTDFMSPSDCKLLFNVCDPVLCPSSRCDLGGKYRVDNVISSGIIGSIALCLPNSVLAGGDVIVPVCMSGIYAGLDSYVSILKAHRDCLKENLETGRYVGICDEIYSIYLCEFFWRQIGPFMDVLAIKLFETIHGKGMKGGGEYLTVQNAWSNAEKTVDYIKNDYAVNAINAFKARSTGEIGTEFCKAFVSARYPTNKKFFDNLLAPDSPVQFQAWFDEIPYTEVTVPATSQYKVYYHVYAGKDSGVNYQVYLKNPPESAYVKIQDIVIVDTGFIPRGGYASETRDFTAPSSYKELCVRINGKDECGFKKVATSFALNYLSDKYYEEQASEEVKTEKECLTGTASLYSILQPNVQESAEDIINPSLDKKGVIRICSSDNPNPAEPQRWKDVGYCDDENVDCWIDMNSVKEAIKDKGIESEAVGDIKSISGEIDKENLIYDEKAKPVFTSARADIEKIRTGELSDKDIINQMIAKLDDIEDRGAVNSIKAEAAYLKFEIYFAIVEKIVSKESPMTETAKTSEGATTSEETGFILKDNKIYYNGKYIDLYLEKTGDNYLIKNSNNIRVGSIIKEEIEFDINKVGKKTEEMLMLEKDYIFTNGRFILKEVNSGEVV